MSLLRTITRTLSPRLGLDRGGAALPVLLELDLSRGVLGAAPAHPLAALRKAHAPTMRDLRDGLRKAAEDASVLGLVVHVGPTSLSFSETDELGELVEAFAQHKPTLAWSESFGELVSCLPGYRLAVRAQEIWLQPSGAVGLHGVSLSALLLRGGLDKLGVDPEFGQRQEFKTAANQYTATEITQAQAEMMQRIADSLVEDTVRLVARRRGLDEQVVRDAMAASPVGAERARELGLIDSVGYRDEVYDHLRRTLPEPPAEAPAEAPGAQSSEQSSEQSSADATELPDGHPEPSRLRLQYVHRYAQSGAAPVRRLLERGRANVAVVTVDGPIVYGLSQRRLSGQICGSETVGAQLRAAGRDDAIEGVLLRVDSPGGSYVASDTIRREVQALRRAGKPVVASMGAMAASGGYFVAMGADEVVAAPSTLTGSIGVLAGKLVTERLFDRLGLIRGEFAAGGRATMMSTQHGFSEDDWAALNAWLDVVYVDFTTKAAQDRGMSVEELEPNARGRVWTGADAKTRGLIDHLGGLDLALDRLCALAELDRSRAVLRSGPAFGLIAELRPADSSEAGTAHLGAPAGWEGTLAGLAEEVGVGLPHGVLALPWRLAVR